MFQDQAQTYTCPQNHDQHKAAIIRILTEAATDLHTEGQPEYTFTNPKDCVCRRDVYDVVFYFGVDVAGGGGCSHGENGMCQGMTRSSTGAQVKGKIIAPPQGTVVFSKM